MSHTNFICDLMKDISIKSWAKQISSYVIDRVGGFRKLTEMVHDKLG